MSDPIPSSSGDGLPMPRRLVAILALCFGTALAVIDGAIANVALPTIARDLGTSNSAVVLIVTVYQLVIVMTILPMSALGDRLGLRTLYQGGQILFTLASLACFFADSLPVLLAIRGVQALGAGAALSVSTAQVRSIYPKRQLGRGLALNGVIVGSSAALAPTLGGAVLAVAPWPWIFAVGVPFGILSLLLGRALPEPQPRPGRYDVVGALMCAATFGLLISGIQGIVQGGHAVLWSLVLIAGAGLGSAFVRRELLAERPIMPFDLLGRPIFALSTAASFAAFCASTTLLLSLPFRLQHLYGFTPAEAGAMVAPWPLTMLAVSPAFGALSDRVHAGLLGAVGMTVATVGLLTFTTVPAHPGYVDLAWRLVLTAIGFGMFMSPNQRLQIGAAPPDRTASAGGLIATTRIFGQTMGATMVAALFAFGVGGGAVPAMVAAGLTLIAGLCSIARLRAAATL